MSESHQERTYRELQGSRPCIGRGELQLDINHVPATACCKAKDIVVNAKFYCKILPLTDWQPLELLSKLC